MSTSILTTVIIDHHYSCLSLFVFVFSISIRSLRSYPPCTLDLNSASTLRSRPPCHSVAGAIGLRNLGLEGLRLRGLRFRVRL